MLRPLVSKPPDICTKTDFPFPIKRCNFTLYRYTGYFNFSQFCLNIFSDIKEMAHYFKLTYWTSNWKTAYQIDSKSIWGVKSLVMEFHSLLEMGDSRKYPYYSRTAVRISEGEAGGFTIMEFWGHGGVFTIGNPKAWGNSTGGISGVESVEWVPWKRYCCGLL